MDDDNVTRILQYENPPLWMEWSMYIGTVLMFCAAVVTGHIAWTGTLAGGLLYWNYRLYEIIRAYVRYVNASEISKLLVILAEHENNKQKDGTFQYSDGLTKEQGDEENPDG